MKTVRGLVLAIALGVAAGARAEVEFAGYLTSGGETRFTLTDGAAQTTSEWLPVGASFSGYKIVSFDSKGEVLTVEKAGLTSQLRLKSSRVTGPTGGAPVAVGPVPAPTQAPTASEGTPPPLPLPTGPSEAEVAEARVRASAAEARLQTLLAQREKMMADNPELRARMSQQAPVVKRFQAEEEKRAKEKAAAATSAPPNQEAAPAAMPDALPAAKP